MCLNLITDAVWTRVTAVASSTRVHTSVMTTSHGHVFFFTCLWCCLIKDASLVNASSSQHVWTTWVTDGILSQTHFIGTCLWSYLITDYYIASVIWYTDAARFRVTDNGVFFLWILPVCHCIYDDILLYIHTGCVHTSTASNFQLSYTSDNPSKINVPVRTSPALGIFQSSFPLAGGAVELGDLHVVRVMAGGG